MLDNIEPIIDSIKQNASYQYNPRPLFNYLKKAWLTVSAEPVLNECLSASALDQVNLICTNELQSLLGSNWKKNIRAAIKDLKKLNKALQKDFPSNLQPQIDNAKQVLNLLLAMFSKLRLYLYERETPVVFDEVYDHAMVFPDGHCFTYSNEYYQQTNPDPYELRGSQHYLRYCDGIYQFLANTLTQPTAEKLGRQLVGFLVGNETLFPTKTPCIVLSYLEKADDNAQNNEPQTEFRYLSLKVPGVTLESLFYAKDAFQALVPGSPRVSHYPIIDVIRTIINKPPKTKLLTEEALSALLHAQYPDTDFVHPWVTPFVNEPNGAYKLYLVLSVLNVLDVKPNINKLESWIDKAMRHVRHLENLIRHYGLERSIEEFYDLLTTALTNIDPHQIHLLALDNFLLTGHDAVGTNYIVDLSTPPPFSLKSIDSDWRLDQRPIKENTSKRHYALNNTIFTNFEQFYSIPLALKVVEQISRSSPEEAFLHCLAGANQFDMEYDAFTKLFKIDASTPELHVPLRLAEQLVKNNYQFFQRLFESVKNGERRLPQLLSRMLPNTYKVALIAYEKTKNTPSAWRAKFFDGCPHLEDLFGSATDVVYDPVEIGPELVHDFSLSTRTRIPQRSTLRGIIRSFLLAWIDYKELSTVTRARLYTQALPLVGQGVLTQAEVDGIRQGHPRQASSCPATPSESSKTSPRDEESPPASRRNSSGNGSSLSRFFTRKLSGLIRIDDSQSLSSSSTVSKSNDAT